MRPLEAKKIDHESMLLLAAAVMRQAVEDRDVQFFESAEFADWCELAGADPVLVKRAIDERGLLSISLEPRDLLLRLDRRYRPGLEKLAAVSGICTRTLTRMLRSPKPSRRIKRRIRNVIIDLDERVRFGLVSIEPKRNSGGNKAYAADDS